MKKLFVFVFCLMFSHLEQMFYQILTKAKAFLLFKLLYADLNLYQLFENICKSLLAGYLANRFVCRFESIKHAFHSNYPTGLQAFFSQAPYQNLPFFYQVP